MVRTVLQVGSPPSRRPPAMCPVALDGSSCVTHQSATCPDAFAPCYAPLPLTFLARRVRVPDVKEFVPQKIIVHHSASPFGDYAIIDSWHALRGFHVLVGKKIVHCGYHFIILNGVYRSNAGYDIKLDGHIDTGRPITVRGAHCKGRNFDSIGICMIGPAKKPDKSYSELQILTLTQKVRELCATFSIPFSSVYGHKEWDDAKPLCPMLDMIAFRASLDTTD